MKISEALQNLKKFQVIPNAPKAVQALQSALGVYCLKLEHLAAQHQDLELTEAAFEKYQQVIVDMTNVKDNPNTKENRLKAQAAIRALNAIKNPCEIELDDTLEGASLDTTGAAIGSPSATPKAKPGNKAKAGTSGTTAAKTESTEWLTPENVEKVKQKLLALSANKDNKELASVAQMLDRTYNDYKTAQGEQQIKMKDVLYNIIHMPGWGHVQDERDEYRTMSRENVNQRIREARERIKTANLVGTEEVTKQMIDSTSVIWRKMTQADGEAEGQELPINKVGVPPVFCIDGPPGTGKTTIAQAVAEAMDMGFYDLSMAGKDDSHIVYGHGKQWGAPSPGLVAAAQIKSKRQRVVILLDEAEKATGSVPNALGQILEKTSVGYKDDYFEANVDKRKAMFVLTTNKFELLPEHIQSRVRKVYFGGYDDKTKVKILKNMAVNAIGRLQESVQFQTADRADEARTFDGKPFKGFKFSDGQGDVIEYIVKNYITEPGVREAKDLLDSIVTHASAKADDGPVVIDIALVHEALGKPNPLNAKIKELNQKIGESYKALSELRDKINEEYNDEADKPVDERSKQKFSALLQELETKKRVLLGYENQIVDVLGQKGDKKSKEHQQEHLASIVSTQEWTKKLADKINARYFPGAAQEHTDPSAEQNANKKADTMTDTERRIAALEEQLAALSKKLKDPAAAAAAEGGTEALRLQNAQLQAELARLKAEQEASRQLGTGKSQQLSGRSPVILSGEGSQLSRKPTLTFEQQKQYQGVTYGFSAVQRLKKEAQKDNRKPGLSANVKLTDHEFSAICDKEIKKIAKMKKLSTESNLRENLGKVNQALQDRPHTSDQAASKVKEQFEGTKIARDYTEPKTYEGGREKYSAMERFEHKLNTIAMYETLSATKSQANGVSTLTINENAGDGREVPIVNVTHNQTSGLVKIVSEHDEPGDKALLQMALFAQKCSKSGKFNVQNCEENAEAAIKLYLFGRSLDLNPQLNAKTQEKIARYVDNPKDPTLAGIFKEASKNPSWSGSVILAKLEDWEKEKKQQSRGLQA